MHRRSLAGKHASRMDMLQGVQYRNKDIPRLIISLLVDFVIYDAVDTYCENEW